MFLWLYDDDHFIIMVKPFIFPKDENNICAKCMWIYYIIYILIGLV